MHRIDNDTAVPAIPAPAAAGAGGYFSGGNPGPGGIPADATDFDPDWCNDIQEECVAVATVFGDALDKTNHGQMLSAIQRMVQKGYSFALDTGAANAYIANPLPQITALSNGLHVTVIIGAGNSQTNASPTLKVGTTGYVPILGIDGQAPPLGYIKAGMPYTFRCDGANWRLPCSQGLVSGNPSIGGVVASFSGFTFCSLSDSTATAGMGNLAASNRLFTGNSYAGNNAEFVQGKSGVWNVGLTYAGGGAGSQNYLGFWYGASQIGSVTGTPSGITVNNTSDERVKSDIAPIDETLAGDFLDALAPKSFRLFSKNNPISYGVLAQQTKKAVDALGMDAEGMRLVTPGTPDGHEEFVHTLDKDHKRIPVKDAKTGEHLKDDDGQLRFAGQVEKITLGHRLHRLWGIDLIQSIPFLIVRASAHRRQIAQLEKDVADLKAAVAALQKAG